MGPRARIGWAEKQSAELRRIACPDPQTLRGGETMIAPGSGVPRARSHESSCSAVNHHTKHVVIAHVRTLCARRNRRVLPSEVTRCACADARRAESPTPDSLDSDRSRTLEV